jgi:hypothetical protein
MAGPISTPTNTSRKSSNAGAIAGGVIGGLAALLAIAVGLWIFLRRRATVRSDQGFPDYSRVSTGTPTVSELDPGKQPTQLRLYVRVVRRPVWLSF